MLAGKCPSLKENTLLGIVIWSVGKLNKKGLLSGSFPEQSQNDCGDRQSKNLNVVGED